MVNDTSNAAASGLTGSAEYQYLLQLKDEQLKAMRPWRDFFDRTRFQKPLGLKDVQRRMNHNLVYYQRNYAVIVAILCLYMLITNISLLFVASFMAIGYVFLHRLPKDYAVRVGRTIVTLNHLYALYVVVSTVMLWFASAGSAVFWVVGASAVAVGVHASFLEIGVEHEFREANQV